MDDEVAATVTGTTIDEGRAGAAPMPADCDAAERECIQALADEVRQELAAAAQAVHERAPLHHAAFNRRTDW